MTKIRASAFLRIRAFALITVCLLALPGVVRAQGAGTPDPPSISVTGVGEVRVKPDIARLEIGVQTFDKDAAKAAARNNVRADALLRAMRALGVRESDLQTSAFEIEPQYDNGKTFIVTGYTVKNTIVVTVRKIADLSKALDAAVKAGANIATGVTFDLNEAEKQKAVEEAMTEAVADSRRQAFLIARAAGIAEIELHSLSKNEEVMESAGVISNNRALAVFAGGGQPITVGKVSLITKVSATYWFKPAGAEAVK